MTDMPDPIPSGRIDAEPLDSRPRADREEILRAVLADAEVELGAYD